MFSSHHIKKKNPNKLYIKKKKQRKKSPKSEIMSYQQKQQPPPSPSADTALTKLFVGGLAWETQTEALRDHFNKFGDIIEAVIITDKLTGRSKGYGFVTFKEAEAAKKACEDSAPVINGRKGNCNIASVGAKRGGVGKISPPATPVPPPSTYPGGAGGSRSGNSIGAVRPSLPVVHWYFSTGAPSSSPTMSTFHQHYGAGVLPYYSRAYGYSPPYIAPTNMGYRTKVNHSGAGGAYLPGQFSYPAQGGMVAPIALTPMYHPMYEFHHNHHLHHSMGGVGIPAANFFQPATAISYSPVPAAHTSKFPVVSPSKC